METQTALTALSAFGFSAPRVALLAKTKAVPSSLSTSLTATEGTELLAPLVELELLVPLVVLLLLEPLVELASPAPAR